MTGNERSGNGVAAVDRAIALLRAVASANGPSSLADLARTTGLYKSTLLRLAASLQGAGLVMRDAEGRFRLGPSALELGTRFQESTAPSEVLLPAMRRLAEQSGESIAFYVPAGAARVCLYRVDSTQALRYSVQVGDVLPLNQGSGGRVIAAFLGAAGALSDRIRQQGHHLSDGERDPGVAGVSVPVLRKGGELVGALTLAGPRVRLTPTRLAELVPVLKAAAVVATRALAGEA